MRCKEAKRLISPYIDGELSPKKKKEFEEHLEFCPQCKKELKEWEKILKEIHRIPKIDSSINFSESLWYKYQNENFPEKTHRKIYLILGFVFVLIFIFFLSQKIFIKPSEPQELQTFYEIHGRWGKPVIFEEPSIDFVFMQNP